MRKTHTKYKSVKNTFVIRSAILMVMILLVIGAAGCAQSTPPATDPATTQALSTTDGQESTSGESTTPVQPTAQQQSTAAAAQSTTPAQTGASAAAQTPPAGKQTEALTIAITRDENTITPITYVTGTPGFDVMKLIYDSLFAVSAENTVIPWMVADDYKISPDYKEIRFTLLDGLKWHDGSALTAEDVVFTFEYFRDTYTHSRWTPLASKVESITANGSEITLTLKQSDFGYLRDGLADMRIIPKKAFDGAADPNDVPNMGSGAYRLVDYRVGEFYTLEAMDDYFRGTPKVKTLRMPIITDSTVIQQALIAGEIAASTSSISPELIETFEQVPGIEVAQSAGFSTAMLFMNNEREPLNNPDVRRAISRAIDLDSIVNQVLLGYGKKGTLGYVREGLDEYVPGLDHIYDPAEANTLLDAAGFSTKNASGMRLDASGKELAFELLAIATSPPRIRSAEIIAQHLAVVGINVTVSVQDYDSVIAQFWPGFDTAAARNYDMVIQGWSAPVVQRSGAIIGSCYGDFAGAGGQNVVHYKSAEFDALAAQFLASTDTAERAQLNEQMQKIAAYDVPFVTLFFPDTLGAVNMDMYDGWVFAEGALVVNVYSFLDMK